MKRMNLIRAALLAVFAFMGTVSLSAQQNWLPAPQAMVVITNELNNLANPPAPSTGTTLQTKQQVTEAYAKSGCTDCMLHSVKEQFLLLTLKEIKLGADTGAAVESVRALMIQHSNGNGPLLATIQTAYQYMDSIL
ncbi:MAG: hypothetical protein JNN28_08340 [Saprospiraceae bacterium]|nr:hypothetical protein [Saprospiraceae bacterium]